jgi:hypothetical protein
MRPFARSLVEEEAAALMKGDKFLCLLVAAAATLWATTLDDIENDYDNIKYWLSKLFWLLH